MSERARKCAQMIWHGLRYGDTDVEDAAAIIDRHFKGYEEALKTIRSKASAALVEVAWHDDMEGVVKAIRELSEAALAGEPVEERK